MTGLVRVGPVRAGPYEIVSGKADAPVFLTCEHASEALPEGYRWSAEDQRLLGTHWASDLGARDVTLDLAAALGAPSVLATFSRLLIDPNRPIGSDTLFRREADDAPVELNRDLSSSEEQARIANFYEPFHDAVSRELANYSSPLVLAIHTYTPMYQGQPRHLELGVLFDQEDALGAAWVNVLRTCGYDTEPNEPWSGKAGLIYVAQTHADQHGRRAMELEIRQDLAVNPAFRRRLIPDLCRMLRA